MMLRGVALTALLVAPTAIAQTFEWVRVQHATPWVVFHSMSWDETRGRAVAFGGMGGLNNTIEWDGSGWTVTATTGPSPRSDSAMAYDARRGVVVLYGGANQIRSSLSDTWEWNGVAWTNRTPSADPGPRHGHSLAYHAGRQRVMLFGGLYRSDTWEWDGTTWTLVSLTAPEGMLRGGMVYDSARGVLVAHTGNSTLEWDGGWTTRSTSGPSPRNAFSMAYDRARSRTVLAGGWPDAGPAPTETWDWDGTTWTRRHVGALFAPGGQAMVFDPVRQQLLLMGGPQPNLGMAADTWVFRVVTDGGVGEPADGGERLDAGDADAGMRDAGPAAAGGDDAGPRDDAGSGGPPRSPTGCGCSSGSEVTLWGMLLLARALPRRRRC